MFDDFDRQLRRIPRRQVVPVRYRLDADGYLDRRCPAPECGAAFKVAMDDWKGKVAATAWCAICGEQARSGLFDTPSQRRHARNAMEQHISRQVDEAVARAHRPVVRSGLVELTWTYRPFAHPIPVPPQAAAVMTQRSDCEQCATRYASIGAAFFCPACGHNSARSTFAGALTTVRKLLDFAERMPEIEPDTDAAADQARHLAEDSLVRVWFSFQRFAEATYLARPGVTPPRRNAFQSLAESDRLWRGVIGKTYADLLTAAEHRDLVRLVQARNVAHRDGFVDADYVARSGDHRYAVGQRLVITVADARRIADLTEKLSAAL